MNKRDCKNMPQYGKEAALYSNRRSERETIYCHNDKIKALYSNRYARGSKVVSRDAQENQEE